MNQTVEPWPTSLSTPTCPHVTPRSSTRYRTPVPMPPSRCARSAALLLRQWEHGQEPACRAVLQYQVWRGCHLGHRCLGRRRHRQQQPGSLCRPSILIKRRQRPVHAPTPRDGRGDIHSEADHISTQHVRNLVVAYLRGQAISQPRADRWCRTGKAATVCCSWIRSRSKTALGSELFGNLWRVASASSG
jgi:hypothetical protein